MSDRSIQLREDFSSRHIGPDEDSRAEMLGLLGVSSLDELVNKIVPPSIRFGRALSLPEPVGEREVLQELRAMLQKNISRRSLIGMGYSGTILPPVILRNVLENPGWYTQYTPYQAEISQGRLEALINFQTLICDLTGLEIANASLLDEGTAAAEAMALAHRVTSDATRSRIFIASNCHPQTIDVVRTRAEPLGIECVIGSPESFSFDQTFYAALLQYPSTDGGIDDYRSLTKRIHDVGALCIVAADILALALLTPPGEWDADVCVGNSQRFGVPLGFGGPHAGFLATRTAFSRQLPGRVVGVSKDAEGQDAYRLAIQVREQHIKREKATSNICTAQVLLAVVASMYAVYHGPQGIRRIAERVNALTRMLAASLTRAGCKLRHESFFDTLRVDVADPKIVHERAEKLGFNLRRYEDKSVGVALDETVTVEQVSALVEAVTGKPQSSKDIQTDVKESIPRFAQRSSSYLTHPVFNTHHSETELLRYIHRLQSKDLSLTTSMIPLGSCTMKLNATVEMIPVTWPEVSDLHPFAPEAQTAGMRQMIGELEQMLGEITGLPGVSLQPNAGSQGEYAGLLVIRAYHRMRGGANRDVCLIPASAHGTNPASAAMAGFEVVIVKCDAQGNVDLGDLREKADAYKEKLAAIMVTYPSTHGVFEEGIRHICDTIHAHGGLVYMDGANMNAQVGLCRPGDFGVDVCHLNLHKTFCIPHGGGGPGVGPIAVRSDLVQFLPRGPVVDVRALAKESAGKAVGPTTSAPWGSASILVIPWVYIRLMGAAGLRRATEVAMLNANYIAKRLDEHFPVLYRGEHGFVAHECILDLRNFKRQVGIEVQDVAKRLMDYGFHAPTVSFPVIETLMVEPTESESKEELDRFCDALIAIRQEIREIELGVADPKNNVLKNAPHTALAIVSEEWGREYSREKAAFPMPSLRAQKYWPPVARIDSAYGDRNLFCTCVPVSGYENSSK